MVFLIRKRRQRQQALNINEVLQDSLQHEEPTYAPFGAILSKDITDKKEIGRGQYGIVYRGFWAGKIVAVKVLPGFANDKERQDFYREFQIMR